MKSTRTDESDEKTPKVASPCYDSSGIRNRLGEGWFFGNLGAFALKKM
jgi:hypothetical protein